SEEVGVGLAADIRQSGAEKVEAVIRIERGRAGREEQGIGPEACDLRLLGVRAERIVRRPLGTRDFARQTRRLSDQVDEPDWPAGPFRQRDIVAEPVLQAIGEMQLAVEYYAGEDLTAKRLADGADAKHRVGVGLHASVITDAAETGESRLAVAR